MVFGTNKTEQNKQTEKLSKFDDKAHSKTMELIKNKKLYETAKKLADEIEGFMRELKILQNRSYPNIPWLYN